MSESGSDGPAQFVREPVRDENDFEDKEIDCVDCGNPFVWTAGEQLFFRDKGLKHPPKRCKPCKKAKNERLEAVVRAQQEGVKQRIEVVVHCAKCGVQTTVPFYPSQGRPVYCRSCFLEKNPETLPKDDED
ncbi:MAG TPA: zinc-ribbon domain containing protein [Aridibacter sp.]|nr:zinc-ribbon domain containing protein [Aridibacter sp.]